MAHPKRLTADDVWFEVGRRVQAVALVMRKHTIASSLGVCSCGRLPTRELPMFGQRCDTASGVWDRANYAISAVLGQAAHTNSQRPLRATGRATVHANRTSSPHARRWDV